MGLTSVTLSVPRLFHHCILVLWSNINKNVAGCGWHWLPISVIILLPCLDLCVYISRTQLLHPANKLELVFFPLYQNDNRIGSASLFSSAGAVLKWSRNRSGYMRLIKRCHFQMDFLVLNLSYLFCYAVYGLFTSVMFENSKNRTWFSNTKYKVKLLNWCPGVITWVVSKRKSDIAGHTLNL